MVSFLLYPLNSVRNGCCHTQILILADESVEDSAIQADSRSLATLLLIRDIQVRLWRMLTNYTWMRIDSLVLILFVYYNNTYSLLLLLVVLLSL